MHVASGPTKAFVAWNVKEGQHVDPEVSITPSSLHNHQGDLAVLGQHDSFM